MKWLIALCFFLPAFANAQTCKDGTPTQPACSRDWSTGPLTVIACPADPATGSEAGVKLLVKELDGTPILSVVPGTPGGSVTLATSSAPKAVPANRTRVIEFSCDGATVTGGKPTYASITFPLAPAVRPAAPVLQ